MWLENFILLREADANVNEIFYYENFNVISTFN